MKNFKGVVDKIRILNFDARPLLRFTLNTENGSVNCLIAAHSLNFLADVAEGMTVAVAGEFNNRKQLVVRRYSVIGKTQLMVEFETLNQSVSL